MPVDRLQLLSSADRSAAQWLVLQGRCAYGIGRRVPVPPCRRAPSICHPYIHDGP